MRSRCAAFVLTETLVAIGIFCGLLLATLAIIDKTTRCVAVDVTRVNAGCYLGQVLDEVRLGVTPVEGKGTVQLSPRPAPEGMPGERCSISVEQWGTDSNVSKVTVKLEWGVKGKEPSSISAVTLVRTTRLHLRGGK